MKYTRDHLRVQRERLDEIEKETEQHFQVLHQLYHDPTGVGASGKKASNLESQIGEIAGEALAEQFHELAERREHISNLRNKLKAEEDSAPDKANQQLLHAQRERLDGMAAKISQRFQSVGRLYGQSHGSSLESSAKDDLEAKIADMAGEATANWFHRLATSRDEVQKLRKRLEAEYTAEEKESPDTEAHRSMKTQQERLAKLATNLEQHFQSLGDLYGASAA